MESVDQLKVSSYLDWTPLPSPYQHVELPVSGIKDALPEWLSSLPDFEFTSDRMIAEDDFVVCLGHWRAHHKGTYKGISPTDRSLGGSRIDIFRVVGDKMVEHWGCGNELAFLQMIGALSAPQTGESHPATPADIVRTFIERVLGQRDLATVAELLDPAAVDRGGLALSLLGLLQGFPDLTVSVDDVAVDDGEVRIVTTVSGTHSGTFMGIPPTDRRVTVQRQDRYLVDGGRIMMCERLSDDTELIEQLT